jgi:hypothetical protein
VPRCERACGVGIHVDHVEQTGLAHGSEIGGMDCADTTGTELSKAEHGEKKRWLKVRRDKSSSACRV